MNKIEEIFKAWKISYNPDNLQSELAIKRMEICDICDSKRDNPVIHCNECGCLLSKKIYSPVIRACPKGKWIAVEMEFEHKKNKKIYDSIKNNIK
jgi:hypothetical protein